MVTPSAVIAGSSPSPPSEFTNIVPGPLKLMVSSGPALTAAIAARSVQLAGQVPGSSAKLLTVTTPCADTSHIPPDMTTNRANSVRTQSLYFTQAHIKNMVVAIASNNCQK